MPYRFLSPWFSKELLVIPDHKKNAMIEALSLNSQGSNDPSPYFFMQSNIIRLNPSWTDFFQGNLGVIMAFIKYHAVCYLQRRNPNTPNVVNKLEVPVKRDLSTVRRFWNSVRDDFVNQGNSIIFSDIYSGITLPINYAIDHFCPWSFVVHDQIWNLVPVEQNVNSSKGDRLPDLDYYLPRMAKLHIQSLKVIKHFPSLIEEFAECHKESLNQLAQYSEDEFCRRMRDIFLPLFTVARNQASNVPTNSTAYMPESLIHKKKKKAKQDRLMQIPNLLYTSNGSGGNNTYPTSVHNSNCRLPSQTPSLSIV